MSTPGQGAVAGSFTIYGKVDYGPTFGQVYRPLNQKRLVTAAGNVPIIPFDVIVIIQQTIAAAFNLILPDLGLWMRQPYGGFDLIIKNRNFGFDMTVVPFGAQRIDGIGSLIVSGGQGEGAVILSPLNDLSGWDTI
jgi:hypothetical protein